jgi:hypothetical protein
VLKLRDCAPERVCFQSIERSPGSRCELIDQAQLVAVQSRAVAMRSVERDANEIGVRKNRRRYDRRDVLSQ